MCVWGGAVCVGVWGNLCCLRHSMCKKVMVALSLARYRSLVMPSPWGTLYPFSFHSFPWTCAGPLFSGCVCYSSEDTGAGQGPGLPWCQARMVFLPYLIPTPGGLDLPMNQLWNRISDQGTCSLLEWRPSPILGMNLFTSARLIQIPKSGIRRWAKPGTRAWCHVSGPLTAKDS